MKLLAAAAAITLALTGCVEDLRNDRPPYDSWFGGPDQIGELVASWNGGAALTDQALLDRQLVHDQQELEAWVTSARELADGPHPSYDAELDAVAAIDMDAHVVLIDYFFNCATTTGVFTETEDDTTYLWMGTWQEELIDCADAPPVLQVWEVALDDLDATSADEIAEGLPPGRQ